MSLIHTLTNELAHWRGERAKSEEGHYKFHSLSAIVGYYCTVTRKTANVTRLPPVTVTRRLSGVSFPDHRSSRNGTVSRINMESDESADVRTAPSKTASQVAQKEKKRLGVR